MAQVPPDVIAEFLRRAGASFLGEYHRGPRGDYYARSEPPRAVNPIADGKRTIRMNRYSDLAAGNAIDLPRSEWRWL